MTELIAPVLDVFAEDPLQLSIIGYDDLCIQPINNVEVGSGCEFFVNGFHDSLKDLSEIFLMATIRFLKADGTVYTTGAQPSLVNGGLTSLFKKCSLYLNQTLVQEIDNYGIVEHINNTLNFSAETALARMSNQGFFTSGDRASNQSQLNNSMLLQLMTKINILNSPRLLIPNVSLGLKLDFNTPAFYIMERAAVTGSNPVPATSSKIEISDMKLMVRHYAVRAPYLLHVESMLSKTYTAKYCYQYCHIVTSTVAAGQSSFSSASLWNGIKPSLMLLCFIKNSTFVGDKYADPFLFAHNNVSDVRFTINNIDYPRDGLQFKHSPTESKYARVFHALHSSLGIHHENTSTNVTRDNFLSENFFILHDCSNWGQSLTTLREPLSIVNAGINVTFSTALTDPLTCILLMLLPRRIEIDSVRKVKVIY